MPDIAAPPRQPPVDVVLKICHRVFKLEHLHLGYWEDGEAPVLANCHRAQDRFLERLVEHIPEGVRSVCDVGCGLGALSRWLRERGYEVEAINPDPYQGAVFRERAPDIPLHAVTLEDFRPARRFDLMLSSESCQYIDLRQLFPAFRRCLADDGPRLALVSDWFVKPEGRWVRGHREDAFRAAAAEAGFEIVRESDITEAVLPTLACLQGFLNDYTVPAVETLEELAELHMPWRTRLLRWFLGGRLPRFHRFLRDELPRHFDPEAFRANVRYLTFLLRHGDGG